ncbi:MAG TPA: phospholipase D-like domain-containing protein, partial [Candidatus Lokiarchaeia archaeon]|nr:phospholipase D-like domain-containing protein [Candidatus Lokiarchaeia archaeon]
SFSPHRKPKNKTDSPFPLKTIADAVTHAKRSVFFALMEAGEGAAIDALNAALDDPKVLCIGVTQSKKGFNVRRADIDPSAAFTSFSFLDQKVPKHFQKEWRGGEGQVIHHKFVVCDFNGPNPVVFCGSSNLARGGEEENGDNLLAIYDPDIATYYAVEALRLFDHYHFRSMEENAASPQEILLDQTANWAQTYFDPNHFKCREREILAGKQML